MLDEKQMGKSLRVEGWCWTCVQSTTNLGILLKMSISKPQITKELNTTGQNEDWQYFINWKNQSSQSCSNHIVQSFTVLFYWKDNLLCKGKMMLTNERLHEMGREERGTGWVTHYYWNARCLISTTVQAAHNYGLLEVIQNRFIRGGDVSKNLWRIGWT